LFLFIFESLGTSELILIGIVALIFLGPRKLPEMARKAGKIMSEFRGTASEFKETWQREVNFEEEAKLLNIKDLDSDVEPMADAAIAEPVSGVTAPTIKEVDPSRLAELVEAGKLKSFPQTPEAASEQDAQTDKKNWL
jgi:sec-independent protein translocase protein TatB